MEVVALKQLPNMEYGWTICVLYVSWPNRSSCLIWKLITSGYMNTTPTVAVVWRFPY